MIGRLSRLTFLYPGLNQKHLIIDDVLHPYEGRLILIVMGVFLLMGMKRNGEFEAIAAMNGLTGLKNKVLRTLNNLYF